MLLKKGEEITEDILNGIPFYLWKDLALEDEATEEKLTHLFSNFDRKVDLIKAFFAEKIEKLKAGDELPPGVIKLVKVYIAVKRKLSVGDKMAGRHGNKGFSPGYSPRRTCPFSSTGPRWTSF